ncbi:feruloyl-CoA synthase [Caldimonas thermodepolymerans]|jgi:Acyl-CoA synthetases (AMP-forming)/AMP-acid ligases II|uniref:feruloyl-CoA synthase n=1 Tax=Caldimonas thermodepolymerans TaxID=215580 RepID=UPI002491A109|nr:feruloyl-CoA synthase [Caldimonas thermodepolymerans]
MSTAPIYRAARIGGCREAVVTERPGGIFELRSTEPLGEYPRRLTDRLEHWARVAPDRTFAARRHKGGDWVHISYREMLQRAQAVGQALLERGLSPERPVVILSENDLEHLTLAFGAMWAGVPFAPISPAYSLISQDFGKLRHIIGKLTPGLVFASRGDAYARAIEACVAPDVEVVLTEGEVPGRRTTPFEALLATPPGAAVQAAHEQVGPDTIVKFLFTSGSTKTPKGVINTHRMMCANLQMLAQSLAFLTDEPPVLVDWLPWNHTFGGNHNVGITLYNGGTLYIDDGRPTPAGIHETLRNLREISPTIYFNVPKGFEEIAAAMEEDRVLRESLFRRVKAFFYSGAGLSQPVWDQLHRLAEQTVGERIPMMTGLGMTETAPSCMFALRPGIQSGHIGLPCPGVEVKLVPLEGKVEVRFRGPNVMPGYWREPQLTAEAFDEEGYYRTGDAVKFVDPADPQKGLMFDGRIAEDFKLATGTFVSVGPLRAKIIAMGAPLVQDVVITGLNRNEVGMLVFPRVDECRKRARMGADVPVSQVLQHPEVRGFFQELLDRLWNEGTGSANRVARAWVLEEPPSIDRGEITDKGSINQRAVLTHRAAVVDALYEGGIGNPSVLLPRTSEVLA